MFIGALLLLLIIYKPQRLKAKIMDSKYLFIKFKSILVAVWSKAYLYICLTAKIAESNPIETMEFVSSFCCVFYT